MLILFQGSEQLQRRATLLPHDAFLFQRPLLSVDLPKRRGARLSIAALSDWSRLHGDAETGGCAISAIATAICVRIVGLSDAINVSSTPFG